MKVITLKDKKLDELKEGTYILDNCQVYRVSNDVVIREMKGDSTIDNITGNVSISFMRDNSKIGALFHNSQVIEMMDNSKIGTATDKSFIINMHDNSSLGSLSHKATICCMHDNSFINCSMSPFCTIKFMMGSSKINLLNGGVVIEMIENSIINSSDGSGRVKLFRGKAKIIEMRNPKYINSFLGKSSLIEGYGVSHKVGQGYV